MFQRLSCLLYSIYPLFCVSMLATYCQTFYRWEGMAPSTNCSSQVNYDAMLRTYLAQLVYWKQREQRSKLTEERHSKTACRWRILYNHMTYAHAPAKYWHDACALYSLPARARFSLVFTPYPWNAVVSGKSPHLHPCSRCSKPVGATHRLIACSARTHMDKRTDRQTDRQTKYHTVP